MSLIDREALIAEYDRVHVGPPGGARKLMVDAPEVRPEQRWIPVTERLPEELEEVNITWININPEPYYKFIKGKPFTGSAVYCKGMWFWYSANCVDYLREYGFSPCDVMDDAIKVLAWMSLPEPYREEEKHDQNPC